MRTSPIKFAHLAEKSEKASISNLSTKVAIGTNNLGTAHCDADATLAGVRRGSRSSINGLRLPKYSDPFPNI